MTATVSTPSTPPAPSTPTHAFDAPPTAKRRDPWQVVRYLAIGAALIFALFPIWFIVAAAVTLVLAALWSRRGAPAAALPLAVL